MQQFCVFPRDRKVAQLVIVVVETNDWDAITLILTLITSLLHSYFTITNNTFKTNNNGTKGCGINR